MSTTTQVVAIVGGIVGLVTLVLGVVYFISTSLAGSLRAEITALRHEMVARFDHLDRDVQRLYEKVFDRPSS